MADPFLAEIRLMSFTFPPRGWALCNGQLLPISQNQALFALLGTTYGGDGRVNFALPDLRGRVPIHESPDYPLGSQVGEAAHTLSLAELPEHSHPVVATGAQASTGLVGPAVTLAASAGAAAYGPASGPVVMDPSAIGTAGGGQAHTNMGPYLTISYCIAVQGIFPSPN